MDEAVKRRVTGAAVLALAGALILPWLFGDPQDPRGEIRPSFSSRPLPVVTAAPARKATPPQTTGLPALTAAPERVVATTRPTASPAPEPAQWILQLASYSDAKSAQAFLERLRQDGHQAYRESVQVRGRRYHRVRLGVAGSQAQARQLQDKLEKRYKLTAQLYPAR